MNKTEIILQIRFILQKAIHSEWGTVLKLLKELDKKISTNEAN
jgi:hypothetical protein